MNKAHANRVMSAVEKIFDEGMIKLASLSLRGETKSGKSRYNRVYWVEIDTSFAFMENGVEKIRQLTDLCEQQGVSFGFTHSHAGPSTIELRKV